jgi:hypothetical protein
MFSGVKKRGWIILIVLKCSGMVSGLFGKRWDAIPPHLKH